METLKSSGQAGLQSYARRRDRPLGGAVKLRAGGATTYRLCEVEHEDAGPVSMRTDGE
jgi:hypothetical protein